MNEIPEAKGLRHLQRIAKSLAQRWIQLGHVAITLALSPCERSVLKKGLQFRFRILICPSSSRGNAHTPTLRGRDSQKEPVIP